MNQQREKQNRSIINFSFEKAFINLGRLEVFKPAAQNLTHVTFLKNLRADQNINYYLKFSISFFLIRMNKSTKFLGLLLLLSISCLACQNADEQDREMGSEEINSLPMQPLSLDDMDHFRATGSNWSVVGNVQSDYMSDLSMEVSEGEGVLANNASENGNEHIFTETEHGDIELRLQFLVPKGSNSGIYFQGRYEIQILDSWKVDEPQFSDVGGIYERWDESRSEDERGYEGIAPNVNAGLAPGLWQNYHILFRAPRFDDEGNKIENARFEWVYLNDILIHENVEVTGPTRAAAFDDEAETGPLMFQGDHGPVAFRNMEYKLFNQTDSLRLGQLEYKIYDYEGDRTPVDFEELELLEEGVTDSFNVADISPKSENYATVFTGDLEVPVTGDYLFETQMDDGGNLYINGDLLIENTGEFDSQRLGAIVHLTEGTHQLELTHFQIMWGTQATLFYEGPGMERRTLASSAPNGGDSVEEPVTVQLNTDQPERVGAFTNYGGEKRTHTLSVGHPEGIHYSYDLNRASFLKFWRDPFADVSQMWRGRGHEQLLVPMNAAVEETAGIPVAVMGADDIFENHRMSDDFEVSEYQINEKGQPVFTSYFNGITIEDHIGPSESGTEFIRTLRYMADQTADDVSARIAQGKSVELLPNGLYRIDGRYYLEILEDNGQEPEIYDEDDIQALFIPVLRDSAQSEIQYQVIW